MKKPYKSIRGDGKPVDPMTGVIPIIKEIEKGILQTIGTGFYIARYGLVMTAAHVVWALKDEKK